jgi:hypothetical protein
MKQIKNNAMRLQAAVLILVSFFFMKSAQSQSNELIVQGQTGKLFLEHTVQAKENWYSVGRLYNANPKEIAPFNHLTLGKMLSIGQTIQIPLTPVNFSQDGKKTPAETLIPVVYVVQEKEWMYRISVNHNKVPIPNLEKWNKIGKDQVHPGLHLIVGYLKVKTALSALASAEGKPAVATVSTNTAGSKPSSGSSGHPPANQAVTTDQPPASTENSVSAPNPPAVHQKAPASDPATNTPAPHFNGGSFRAEFSDGGRSATGQAGTFKSTSGWQDGKYYALINSVPIGTIVKISDPATGKGVYAKVLGQLPDMKESAGLTIMVSNAAAAELGVGNSKFSVGINY